MKLNRYIYSGLLTTLLLGWGSLLTCCTSDTVENEAKQPQEPQHGEQVGEPLWVASLTRADNDPVDAPDPMKDEKICLFLTHGQTTSSGIVLYKGKSDASTGSDINWDSSPLYVKPGNDYEVFGFMPSSEVTGTPTISFSGSAVTMNINGINAVSAKDVCVVIGASSVGETITPGSFNYHAPENTEVGYGVDLLADHIFASAMFQFKVHADYDKLRTVKLKKVTMKLKSESSLPAKVNATVTLTKGNTSPITNVELTSGSGTYEPVELFSDNGYALKVNESKDVAVYFNPAYKGDLVLVSTYDVYDKQGNLTRENCTAENGLGSILNVSSMVRGAQMVIPLTVRPTYLYVLSESDWDYDVPSVETD